MLLIKNGCVHDGLGNILENTDILIASDAIKGIGKNLQHNDADVFDASGKEIFPGFIDAVNMYGCRGGGYNDAAESTNPINPQMNVVYAFDQDSMNFQQLYKYGVTSSGISPLPSNVLAGQTAVFKTYGRNPYEMLVKEGVAVIASITPSVKKPYASKNQTPMTKMGAVSLLVEALRKAKNREDGKGYDAVTEALEPIIKGEIPLFVNCATKSEMDAILLALRPFDKIKIVLTGAYGLSKAFNVAKERNISYIMGDLTFATSPYAANMCYEEIIELMKNDVDIAIGSCGDSYASGKESLLWNAIMWYKNGLNAEEVLKRITSVPAKILGVDEKIGSIQIGKHADLSVWNANPIKTYASQPDAVYIKGENVLLKGRDHLC